MIQSGRTASEVTRLFEPLPQIMRKVRINGGAPLQDRRVKAEIEAAKSELGEAGRLLIRESGTEPVIRVMAEGEDEALVGKLVNHLVETIDAVARRG